jgi:hypothetical protein
VIAAGVDASSAAASTKSGELGVRLDEPNDFHAKAIDQDAPFILSGLAEWFAGVSRISVQRPDAGGETERPVRVTDEMVKAQRLNSLRRKDPSLDAAIDVLDLDIAD